MVIDAIGWPRLSRNRLIIFFSGKCEIPCVNFCLEKINAKLDKHILMKYQLHIAREIWNTIKVDKIWNMSKSQSSNIESNRIETFNILPKCPIQKFLGLPWTSSPVSLHFQQELTGLNYRHSCRVMHTVAEQVAGETTGGKFLLLTRKPKGSSAARDWTQLLGRQRKLVHSEPCCCDVTAAKFPGWLLRRHIKY